MRRVVILAVVSLLGQISVWSLWANAATVTFQPATWYEINTSSNPPPVIVEPSTMTVAHSIGGAFQARAFWEFLMSDITSQFSNVLSASITITRLINPVDRNNHAVQLITYQADDIPPISNDFTANITKFDTFQNAPLPEGDTTFDITAGFQAALQNGYDFFGVGVFVPSTTNGITMWVNGILNMTVTGILLDNDGDGVPDNQDICPGGDDNIDSDGDGTPDFCDTCSNDPLDDIDGDGVCGDVDNCPTDDNPNQEDSDGDGLGNVCDVCSNDANNDVDGDGVCGDVDNCPNVTNPGQEDLDLDNEGDACDADIDGDGVLNADDNCLLVPNLEQTDTDGDKAGDVCDGDDDGDTIPDEVDNCPLDANLDQVDFDTDGIGDACDGDIDGDGVLNDIDRCPDTIIPESVPTERLGNNRYALTDNDTAFDSKVPKGKGPHQSFTTEDSAGCSCEQIIVALGLGKGHEKFGCSRGVMRKWLNLVTP